MIRNLICLILTLANWFAPADALANAKCAYFYKTRIESTPGEQLKYYETIGQFLSPNKSDLASPGKTLFFRGHNSFGQIEFYKPYFVKWNSSKSATSDGFTPHGDIRWFAALSGSEIASHFGFEFKKGISGIRVRAPSASFLYEKVSKLNQQLILNGKDPIVFLPVKTGLIRPEEALKLSVSANGHFLSLFAFEDNHPELTVHEVAWHLGAMLFPIKFHQKSRLIDQETLRMADSIRKSDLPRADEVAQLLIEERAFELDTGNANFAATLAGYRLSENLKSYKDLKAVVLKSPTLHNSVERLVRPNFSAQEAVARRLYIGLQLQDVVDSRPEFESQFTNIQTQNHGKKLSLTLREQDQYGKFIEKYMKSKHYRDSQKIKRESTKDLVENMLDSMDERLDDITQAIRMMAAYKP